MRKLIIITVIESFTLFTARALREVIRGQDLGRSSRKCAFIQRKSLAGIFPNFSQIVRATYGTKFQPGFCWGIRVQKVSIKVKKEDVNVWPMRAKVLALYEIGSFFLSLSQRRIFCDCVMEKICAFYYRKTGICQKKEIGWKWPPICNEIIRLLTLSHNLYYLTKSEAKFGFFRSETFFSLFCLKNWICLSLYLENSAGRPFWMGGYVLYVASGPKVKSNAINNVVRNILIIVRNESTYLFEDSRLDKLLRSSCRPMALSASFL